MLSRVADSLYWMGRNVERADNNARLITVKLTSSLESIGLPEDNSSRFRELFTISGIQLDGHDELSINEMIEILTFNKDNPNSIFSCIEIMRENAKAVREMIPHELWESLNDFYWRAKEMQRNTWTKENIHEFLEIVNRECFHFQGTVESLMPRGDSFIFLKMAQYLERAQKMIRILDENYHTESNELVNQETLNYHHWAAVLQSVSAYEAYLLQYHAFINPKQVVDFLLYDKLLPRSVQYCADQLERYFIQLEGEKVAPYAKKLREELHALTKSLRKRGDKVDMHKVFHEIQQQLQKVDFAVMKTYYLGEPVTA